jgi:hypothetical protein
MPKATYRWKGRIVTKRAYEKRNSLLFLLRYFVTVSSVAANLQRKAYKSSISQSFSTLLLISPKWYSECKCNFATLFLNAEIISVQILKLMVQFFTRFSSIITYEVTNLVKIKSAIT